MSTCYGQADFAARHNPSYVKMGYNMVEDVVPGGTFLLNCQWTPGSLTSSCPTP